MGLIKSYSYIVSECVGGCNSILFLSQKVKLCNNSELLLLFGNFAFSRFVVYEEDVEQLQE